MAKLQNLPIGQQYFAGIREDNNVYIDKTEYIYNLCLPTGRGYFLSRPRRFGKSLTLDTMHELFNGNKALFEGLWIANKWDWTQKNPVIRLSFANIGHKSGLQAALIRALKDIALNFKLTLKSKEVGEAFNELIQKVVAKEGRKVVVLIDEYDKPIVDYIDPYDLTKACEQRDILKDFFGILKDASKDIRLLFITGVSKFSKVSIFSELNHLVDLTLHEKYAALCGYTQEELEHYFAAHLETMPDGTLDKMKYCMMVTVGMLRLLCTTLFRCLIFLIKRHIVTFGLKQVRQRFLLSCCGNVLTINWRKEKLMMLFWIRLP